MSVSGISSSASSSMLEEMRKKMEAAFQSADTDGNGSLSKTEFAAFDKTMKANGPNGTQQTSGASATSSTSGSQGPSADQMFAAMDADGDGSVTQAEMESFKPPMPPEGMGALLQSQESSSSSSASSTDSSTNGNLIAQLLQQLLASYAQNNTSSAASLLSGTSSLSAVTA